MRNASSFPYPEEGQSLPNRNSINDYGNETNIVYKIADFIVLLCFAPSNMFEVIVGMKMLQGCEPHVQNRQIIYSLLRGKFRLKKEYYPAATCQNGLCHFLSRFL